MKKARTRMRALVINKCYGGFDLSYDGMMDYARRKGIVLYPIVDQREEDGNTPKWREGEPYKWLVEYYVRTKHGPPNDARLFYSTKPIENGEVPVGQESLYRNESRDDPALVATVRALGSLANSRFSKLKIVYIPADVEYTIEEYDGIEWVAEKHRQWG